MSIPIHGLALLALAQVPQADTVARPQLDSAWWTALAAELPDTVAADTVPLWVLVDRWGRVDSARVDSSAALKESRERRLLREVRRLRFLPWEEGPGWALVGYPVPQRDSVPPDTAGPEPTGRTTKPDIKNRRRALNVIKRHYPSHLQDAGVGGTTYVWLFVDSTGAVADVQTQESSPRAAEPQRTSFSVRLVFSRDAGLTPSPRLRRASPMPFLDSSGCAGADSVLLSGPQFSPRDEDPQLVTPEWEQARLISDTWPIALQRRHESYEFQFWLLVDTAGWVCKAEVLNEPEDPWVAGKTRHIARRFRFKPARLDGRPVAAWYNYALAFSFVRE